jgi:hypothetical protein
MAPKKAPLTSAERQRRWLAQLKEDPEAFAAWKASRQQKQKERYIGVKVSIPYFVELR